MKKMLKILVIVVGCILLLVGVAFGFYFGFMNPQRGTLDRFTDSAALEEAFTREQALEDLDYVYQKVCERHPAWLDGNDQVVSAFQTQYEKERALLEAKEIVSTLEIWQACARMTSIMRDGHTGVYYYNEQSHYINDVTQLIEYGMPTQIDGITFETIEENFLAIYSYEMEEYALSGFYRSAVDTEHYLAACGVDTSDGVVFTFETPEGEQDFTYHFVLWEEVQGVEVPEEIGNTDEPSWVNYSIDSANEIATFKLTECNYNEEYCEKVDQFWTEVLDEGIQNVIVDLRGNGGGHSGVANYFLEYLAVDEIQGWDYAMRMGNYLYQETDNVIENPKRDREYSGNLYVLTDIHTFSSGMDFAMLISDNHLGTLIGEASGNMPQGYGDVLDFQTPNAKLAVCVSFKKWWRVDQSKSSEPLTPDIETESENALDKAYEIILGTEIVQNQVYCTNDQ